MSVSNRQAMVCTQNAKESLQIIASQQPVGVFDVPFQSVSDWGSRPVS